MNKEMKVVYPKRREMKIERIKRLAIFMLENPKLTRQEISDQFGISYQVLCEFMRDSLLLQAVKGFASKKILGMIPLAVQGFEECLTSKNEKIKYFSSKDLLQSEKIIGPERVDITINDTSSRTIEELQEKIRKGQAVPPPTIDAEIIS